MIDEDDEVKVLDTGNFFAVEWSGATIDFETHGDDYRTPLTYTYESDRPIVLSRAVWHAHAVDVDNEGEAAFERAGRNVE